jgi:hypothetical protein
MDWRDEPIGTDDRTISTQDGAVAEPDSWLAFVHRELGADGGFVIVASGPPDLYAQAIKAGDGYLLEYRDGSADRHFQTTDVSLEEVATALAQWFGGRRDFVADHEWTRIEV